jgi:hypothetical protein
MSASEDRVQEALAAHIAHLELGGPEPDFSHLTGEDREKLEALIGLLDQTEGVAFGRGLDEPRAGSRRRPRWGSDSLRRSPTPCHRPRG